MEFYVISHGNLVCVYRHDTAQWSWEDGWFVVALVQLQFHYIVLCTCFSVPIGKLVLMQSLLSQMMMMMTTMRMKQMLTTRYVLRRISWD